MRYLIEGRLCALLLTLVLFVFCPVVHAEQQRVTFAYLKKGLNGLQDHERQIALQLLADELTRDTNLLIPVKAVASLSEIQRLITTKKLDYVILNSYHFINHYDFFQHNIKKPIWVVQRGQVERENFIIVSSARYAEQSLNSFRGKAISINPQYILMNFYLQLLIKQTSDLDITHFFKKIKHTKTASQAVLDVYFGVSDLCIVPEHIFDLTVELNPAIRKNMAIVHQSGNLFYPILAFSFNHVDQSIADLINTNLSELGNNPRGEKILDMFHIQAIKQITLEQLQPMRQLFLNYQALNQK